MDRYFKRDNGAGFLQLPRTAGSGRRDIMLPRTYQLYFYIYSSNLEEFCQDTRSDHIRRHEARKLKSDEEIHAVQAAELVDEINR